MDEVFALLLRFRILCPAIFILIIITTTIIIIIIIIMKPGTLLSLVSLVLFPLGGEANIQVHKSALLHGAVRMSHSHVQMTGTINLITWRFEKNGKPVTILDTTEKPYFLYSSQFSDRLLMSDELFTLTIMDLTMQDSGIYTIDVRYRNGSTGSNSFNVTVYEPIPTPSLKRSDKKDNTINRCNVTLHCSVPSNTSHLTYTWQSSQRNSKYEIINNGTIIQMSLQNDSVDMEFLCIVQNLVDKKNVSIQVQDICKSTGQTPYRSHLAIIILVVTVLILAIVLVIFIMRRQKGRKEPKENRNAEMHYIEVTTSQREDNQRVQMENDLYTGISSPAKTKAETVYTTLQHPQSKFT